jgi:lysozyme
MTMLDVAYRTKAAPLFRRSTPEVGRVLIREYEGLKLSTYICPGGVLTIGYGHTRTARLGGRVSKEEAEALLDNDLQIVEEVVRRLVEVPLNDHQYAALISFVFNVGAGQFERSTLLRLLNRGWYEQVPAQLSRWNRARGEVLGGLARRRAAEAKLWNKPVPTIMEDGA